MIGNHPKNRRHQTGSYISRRHLYANNRLGLIRSKTFRRRVNDGRINGSTAQTNQNQSDHSSAYSEGDKQRQCTYSHEYLAQSYHLRII